ncbi:MAG: aminomethyl transferase family protein [Phycisphaeraceae bacterium]|nr:aminomethyl transferase family protein [Phycisphaeraceae bacterium]
MSEKPDLTQRIEQLGGQMFCFGPAEADVQMVRDFGAGGAEYAAVRRFVGLMHLPQRGLLRVTGADRQDFLHRMLTQDINTMAAGTSRRSFQLDEKGRIVADLIVHHGDTSGGDTWLDTDVFDVEPLRQLLDKRLFTEDVTLENISDRRTCLALIGPASAAALTAITQAGDPATMDVGQHRAQKLNDDEHAWACRWDDCGSPGFRLWVRADSALKVYDALLEAIGYEHGAEPDAQFASRRRQSLRGRPIGWDAYNTARIEQRSPLYHIDFGPDSLPAETGVLEQAVSHTKGCYLGQEIVARMRDRGHPRKITAAISFESDLLPVAGAQLMKAETDFQEIVGGLTSSTLSPLRGNLAIGLAVVKWGFHLSGVKVAAFAEGKLVQGEIESLNP